MQLGARVVRAGQAAAPEADRRHAEVAAVLLDEQVGRRLGRAEEAVHRRVDPHRLVDSVGVGRVRVVPARLELDELELVRRVAVDLVRREEDERRLRAAAAGGLEQVERPDGVHLEVVERAGGREVVRGLSGSVDDQLRARAVHQLEDRGPVADVERVVLEARRRRAQALQVPGRVAVLAEELARACCCRRRGRASRARRGRRRSRSRSARSSR